MLYTLFGLYLMAGSTSPMDTVERIEGMHLTQSQCESRAKVLAEELGGARCRPESEMDFSKSPQDSVTKIQLPSGRIIKLEFLQGYWFYPLDLEGDDKKLVEDWTGFIYSGEADLHKK